MDMPTKETEFTDLESAATEDPMLEDVLRALQLPGVGYGPPAQDTAEIRPLPLPTGTEDDEPQLRPFLGDILPDPLDWFIFR